MGQSLQPQAHFLNRILKQQCMVLQYVLVQYIYVYIQHGYVTTLYVWITCLQM